MTIITAAVVLDEMRAILERRGVKGSPAADASLREIGFRSLDFSELALRLEDRSGKELTFEAAALRRIERVQDVVDFFVRALG